ncbi:MAG: hypothetical protein ACOYN8_19185, partial [Pseudanabaena sp.]
TESQKARQRALIQTWQPWQQSTGAKSETGKARSSQNALKTGNYTPAALQSHRELRALFRELEAQFKNSK